MSVVRIKERFCPRRALGMHGCAMLMLLSTITRAATPIANLSTAKSLSKHHTSWNCEVSSGVNTEVQKLSFDPGMCVTFSTHGGNVPRLQIPLNTLMTTETRTPRAGAEAHICATRATMVVLKLINFMRFSAGKLSSSQAMAVAPSTSMNE